MTHVFIRHAGLSLLLTASIAAVGAAHARGQEPREGAEAVVQIPGTPDKIWQAIDGKTAELKQSIDGGKLGNVHHQAYAVRDLVAALPARSPKLSAEQKARVQADAKFVAAIAERLDAAGDSNDKAGAQSNYAKLARMLDDLRTLYGRAKAP